MTIFDKKALRATYSQFHELTGRNGDGMLRVSGQTDEPAKVTVDGKNVTPDSNNRFSALVATTTGTNTITVQAKDYSPSQNTTTKQWSTVVTGFGSTSYEYDGNGNLTDDGVRTYRWDARNRLVKISYTGTTKTTEMQYDGLDRRVKIVEKTGATIDSEKRFVWSGMEMAEERASDGTTVTKRFYPEGYVNGGSSSPSASDQFYYLKDHLGSIRGVYGSGGIVVYQDFDPWGRLTLTSGTSSSPADFGYTGHYHHAASGLVLAPFRAYDPDLARWINRDPIEDAEMMPDGPNLYSYVRNNPVNFYDPVGMQGVPSMNSITSNPAIAAQAAGEAAPPVLTALEREVAKRAFGKGLEGSRNICEKALKELGKESLEKLRDIAKGGAQKASEMMKNATNDRSREAAKNAVETQLNRMNAVERAMSGK